MCLGACSPAGLNTDPLDSHISNDVKIYWPLVLPKDPKFGIVKYCCDSNCEWHLFQPFD